jgi:hypothetical protein
VDINSNTLIQVADNFGMFNISFPQVQIVSNRPYHSTASCGHQIYNMPSQGNLNIRYSCDNYSSIFKLVSNTSGSVGLASDYRDLLRTSATQYDDANLIITSLENPDISVLNEILSLTSLTANETALLKYNYYYKKADFATARKYMDEYKPENPEESDFKLLRLSDLDVTENEGVSLPEDVVQKLNSIEGKRSTNSNFAIALLNNSSTYRDYIFEEQTLLEVVKSDNVQHVAEGESYLNIYPNPAKDKVYIEVVNSGMQDGKLQLFDVNGKQVTGMKLNFVAGGIEVDIRDLRSGLYFVTLTDQGSGIIQTGKLVKN